MGWRGLGLFWAALLLVLGGGWAVLQVLGPPSRPPVAGLAKPAPSAPASPAPAGVISPPQLGLLEPSKLFPPALLPRIGPDGRLPRVIYARPFSDPQNRPRIGLVVTGIGMSEAESQAAIKVLPGPVDLAFSPYAPNPDRLVQLSRVTGHEMLVSIPMEPKGYPLNDAGSRSLLTGASPAQNQANLEWALSRIQGYVGATGALDGMRGELFADQSSSFNGVLQELGRRGLLYVDARPGLNGPAPRYVASRDVDLVLDEPATQAHIDAKLAALEQIARDKGSALGLAGPLRPVTVERIVAWARTLEERGLVLAPVSALVRAPAK